MSNVDKVIACLKQIGFKPKINQFSHRLIVQKIIYLLKRKGVDLDFSYSLYIHGPYSTMLAKEEFAQRDVFENLSTSTTLASADVEKVEEFKKIFNEMQASVLEIASTYAYFAFEKHETELDALKKVKNMKSTFPEASIALGVSKAKQFLAVHSAKDVAELKSEVSDWQSTATKEWTDSDEKGRDMAG